MTPYEEYEQTTESTCWARRRLQLAAGLAILSLTLGGCKEPPVSPSADAWIDAEIDANLDDASLVDALPGDAATDSGCLDPPDAKVGDAAVTLDASGPDANLSIDANLPDANLDLDAALLDASPPLDAIGLDALVSSDANPPDAQATDGGATADGGGAPCSADMVLVNGSFCMDRYEASRPDATADSAGTDASYATSRPGVLPWFSFSLTRQDAATACAAAGKRLCTPTEWQTACQGPAQTVYGYGDTYDPITCNGIDRFCRCGSGQACESVTPCPYPHCFNQPPPGGSPPASCGADFHVEPTGNEAGCVNGWGIYDMNGNVWESVNAGDAQQHFRGGAYNCSDSELLHRCDYDATWGPSARGFRCCRARL